MKRDTRFNPGVSGNEGAKWRPGQSGNPAGKSKRRSQFEEAFNEALITAGSAEEAARLLWKAARAGEAWATGTGERADIVVVDDPTSVDQADSDAERRAANDWWNGTMSTRLNDLRTGHRIVIQQRLHEDDLTGNLLDKGGYELLMLPEEFEPERACLTSIGWGDPPDRSR